MRRFNHWLMRLSSKIVRFACLVFILVIVCNAEAPAGGKTEKIADKIAHSGPFSKFGEFLDIIEIFTGGSSVKVYDLFSSEKSYAFVGDLIQIPIRIEFEHENTWDGIQEWIFFEYSIVWNGSEIMWGRIPEEGYYRNENVGRVLRKDLWIGLEKWNCRGSNTNTLTVYGNVYDDAPYAGLSDTYGGRNSYKDPNTSTRNHKRIWGNQASRKFHDTRPIADDSKTLQIVTLNPFYGTKPTKIKTAMTHGEPIGAVHLERDLHWRPNTQSGLVVFSPNSCDVLIDPLESDPPQWIWKMNLPNPATLQRGTHITVRYDGHHVEPDHWGTTVQYEDFNSYTARGKFTLPPVDPEFADLLTAHWKDREWSTIFLYGGLSQDNQCFPARYRASCVHPLTPATDPARDDSPTDERDTSDTPGTPVITPSGDQELPTVPSVPGRTGSPIEEWDKRGWTDPPGAWPDPKKPLGTIKDAIEDLDIEKYDDVNKSVVIPQYALEGDIITGTVIMDSREIETEDIYLFDIDSTMISGLVTVDDNPVAPLGEPTVSSSGKTAWLSWLAVAGGVASGVKLQSKGKSETVGNVDTFPRSHISYPFPDRMLDDPEPISTVDPDSDLKRIWDENIDIDHERIPPLIQYVPSVIKAGGSATIYGYFPHRTFPDDVVPSTNPYELSGIGLGHVTRSPVSRREVIEMLPLASSSIEYKTLLPSNIPVDEYRIYVILGNGDILPTEHTTNVISIVSEGTPVLREGDRGELTIRVRGLDDEILDDYPVNISIENITSDIITLDSGQKQIITLHRGSSDTIVIPFIANIVGEYQVRVDMTQIGDVISPEQAEWLIANRFDIDMAREFLHHSVDELGD